MSLKFAANLSFLYQDLPFLDRIAAAAKDGFEGVEYLFPYDFPAAEIKQRLVDNGIEQALFNAPPGDWTGGERGISSLPGREQEFKDSIARAIEYAAVLGNQRVHVMAGLLPANANRAERLDLYTRNVAWAAEQARAAGLTIVLEPINQRDMPGYLLSYQKDALDVVRAAGTDNLKVQFDCYHAQIMEGDVVMKLRAMFDQIGHIQIASVPSRNEPDGEELNYPFLFQTLDQLGYQGWVGCEYKPRAATSDGLAWLRTYRANSESNK